MSFELLLELFSEEIPARMQARAAADLQRLVVQGLNDAGIATAQARVLYGPRRLALVLSDLPAAAPAQTEERRGPRIDAPAAAIEGFERSTGLTRAQLTTQTTDKGTFYIATLHKAGQTLAQVVAGVVAHTIENFPWPKSMRWGDGTLTWIRPLRNILCILSDATTTQVVPLQVHHLTANNLTYGHRFIAPSSVEIHNAAHYEQALEHAFVVANAEKRRALIVQQSHALCAQHHVTLVEDAALLDEIAGLVEWPCTLLGHIDAAFHTLPAEILQTSMRTHQKFFAARNADGQIACFLTVSNVAAGPHSATIIKGNQRVLTARLADARYFWDLDVKRSPRELCRMASKVTYHARLGTQGERARRVALLARLIAGEIGACAQTAERAALLAKYDLASEVVGEFPELQGIIGQYHALLHNETAEVADAIAQHYRPQGPSDVLPQSPVAVAVAVADKIDRLAGFFVINELPTGSKDPFALRRAALGLLRITLEGGYALPLNTLCDAALRCNALWSVPAGNPDVCDVARPLAENMILANRAPEDVVRELQSIGLSVDFSILANLPQVSILLRGFIADRLRVYLREQGHRHDLIAAVTAVDSNNVVFVVAKLTALARFLATPAGADVLAFSRRAMNILKQEEKRDNTTYAATPDMQTIYHPREETLYATCKTADARLTQAIAEQQYTAALQTLAAMHETVAAFLDDVMVNDPVPAVRTQRLLLLNMVRACVLKVADLSFIEG